MLMSWVINSFTKSLEFFKDFVSGFTPYKGFRILIANADMPADCVFELIYASMAPALF